MRNAEPLYMLDSNIVSALIDRPGTARRELCEQRLMQLEGDLAISVIVDAETRAGFAKSRSIQKEARFLELKRRVRVEYIDPRLSFAEVYAIERASLLRSGAPLSRLDTLIACHAIALGATLVSNDRALARLERLKLENWLSPAPDVSRQRPGVAEPAAVYVLGHARAHGSGCIWDMVATGAAAPSPAIWISAPPAARYATAHAR